MQQTQENRLGTEPVGKLLITMSVPMMISFFIQALYNIVDSMFVARLSENALTAVSLAFPMQQIVNAIAVGMGVGVNACVPRFLARRDQERADATAGNAILMSFFFFVIFALLGLTCTHAIYVFQTDVEEIITLGTSYLTICWSLCIGVFLGQVFEKLLVSTGHSLLAMLSQASGAIINIIFDPLLIFGIGPFPEMGIAGAATATVTGQIFAAALAFVLNLKFNTSTRLHIRRLRPRFDCIKAVFVVGFPSMVTMGLSSVTTFAINQILLGYSTTATAVYGIWIKLQNFCYMPVFGMNNGTVPILSYNYAGGLHKRVKKTIRIAFIISAVYLVLLACVLEFIPGALLSLFSASDNMLSIGIIALRYCIASLPFGGLTVILGSAMQAMEHSGYTLIANILRQFVFIIGLFALISAVTHRLELVWIAVPATEILSLIVSALFMYIMMRKLAGKTC